MNNTYSLILNSQNLTNSNSILGTNQVQYNINWCSILPQQYSQYSLRWQLKATSIITTLFEATINGTTLTVIEASAPLAVGNTFIYNGQIFIIIALINAVAGTWTLNVAPPAAVASTIFYVISTDYNNLAVSVNFGSSKTIDQSFAKNSMIGYIYPNVVTISPNINAYNYSCSYQDNGPTQILTPSNNNLLVSFTLLDGVTINTTSFNYILQLYFTPIVENNNLLSGTF